MNIRGRRLQRDYEKILEELSGSEFVTITPTAGSPPYEYIVSYKLNGLMKDPDKGHIAPTTEHRVRISLPVDYPKTKPHCVMETPVWHPNIGDYVCIGDFWWAGLPLVEIICNIADMIQYRSYNLQSPLNKDAREWTAAHLRSLPVGDVSIRPPESVARTASTAPVEIEIDIPAAEPEVEIELGPVRKRE